MKKYIRHIFGNQNADLKKPANHQCQNPEKIERTVDGYFRYAKENFGDALNELARR